MNILWIFFGVHRKLDYIQGFFLMHFRVFSKGHCTEWGYFLGVLKFQMFFGVLEIPDIFGG